MTAPAKLSVTLSPRDAQRFHAKVDRSAGTNGCWPWTGARLADGYGVFQVGGRARKAHRVAFFFAHGRWPENCVLHACDNRPCANPAHLFEGTNADNMRDRDAKGRQAKGARTRPETRAKGDRNGSRAHPERLVRGQRHPNSRLSDAQVEELRARRRAGETTTALGKAFGISQAHVSAIALGKTRRLPSAPRCPAP